MRSRRPLLTVAAAAGVASLATPLKAQPGRAVEPPAEDAARRAPDPTLPSPLGAGHGDDRPRLEFLRRFGDAAFRHADSLTHLLAIGEGKLLSSSEDGSARLWDAETGRELMRFIHDNGDDVWNAIVLADGSIATAEDDVRIWDPATGKLKQTFAHEESAFRLAAIPGTDLLASSHRDAVVLIRDLDTGEVVKQFAHPDNDDVFSLVAPNAKRLISGDEDGVIICWDLTTGEELSRVEVDNEPYVSTLSLSPDRRRVVANAGSNLICLECDGLAEVWRKELGSSSHVSAWAPDGSAIAFNCDDELSVVEPDKGELIWKVAVPHGDHRAVCFSEDGSEVFSGGDERIYRFSAEDGTLISPAPGARSPAGTVVPATFSADGQTVFSGGLAKAVFAFDRATGQPRGVWETQHPVEYLFRGSDGRLIAAEDGGAVTEFTPGGGGAVDKHWNLESFDDIAPGFDGLIVTDVGSEMVVWDGGKRLRTLADGDADLESVSTSADGRRAATAFDDQGDVRVWNVRSGALLHKLATDADSPDFVVLAPDGRGLALIDDEVLYSWSEPDPEPLPAGAAEKIDGLITKLSSDHFHIRELARIDLAEFGAAAIPLLEDRKLKSPEARMQLAQVLQKLNALVSGKLATAHAFGSDIHSFSIAPDCRQWAAITDRGCTTELVFGRFGADPGTVEILQTFTCPNSARSVRFSPDGSHLLTGNRNTTMCLYRVTPE